jgi:nitrate/TMAO reductase-like tetraheme cytochrome c subunit
MGMGRADDPATVQAMTRAMLGQQCVVCHGDIHKEWQNSLHAFAWRDPIFKAVRERVPDSATRCDHCHAPQPILMTGVGQIPKLRTGERDTGINCITCHMDADGVMHGPNGGTSPFHKTKTDPAFKGIDLCASCHGQPSVPEHDEITEFKKGYGKSGATCHVCHMPSEKRMAGVGGPMRDVGKHTWFGAFSEAQLKGAASVEAKVENGKVVVTITNSAGHPIPGAPYRSIIADVKAMDETNKQLLNEQQVFFKPLDPKQMEDKRIKPGAPRTLTYPITAQKGTVKVQLIYTRPNPAAPLDNTKVYRLVIAETEAKF